MFEAGVFYTRDEREAMELGWGPPFEYRWFYVPLCVSKTSCVFCRNEESFHKLLRYWGRQDPRWKYEAVKGD